MQNVLKVNIMNSNLSSDDVTNDVETSADTNATIFHPQEVIESADKPDSGVGSECSQRHRHMMKTRGKSEVQEMECLLTARGFSMFVYEHSLTEEARTHLDPVVCVTLIQPSFNCTRRTDCDTIQISCFDISLAKTQSNSKVAGKCLCQFPYSTHIKCTLSYNLQTSFEPMSRRRLRCFFTLVKVGRVFRRIFPVVFLWILRAYSLRLRQFRVVSLWVSGFL